MGSEKTIPVILDGKYFKVVSSDLTGNLKARCIECERVKGKQVLIAGRLSVTSNFVKHLKTSHEELFKIFETEKGKRGGCGRKGKRPKQMHPTTASTLEEKLGQTCERKFSSMVINPVTREISDDELSLSNVAHHNFRWYLRSDRVLHQLKNFYLGQEGIPTDVTLFSSDGKNVEAHRLILSLCSPYFQKLFAKISQNCTSGESNRSGPTVIVLGNIPASMLEHLVQFMYTGEVSVTDDDKEEFERLCRLFQMDGISPCVTSNNAQVIQVKVVAGEDDKRRTKTVIKKTRSKSNDEVCSDEEVEVDEVNLVHRPCKIEPSDEYDVESGNSDDLDSDYNPVDDDGKDPDFGLRNSSNTKKRKTKSVSDSGTRHDQVLTPMENNSDTTTESAVPQRKKRGRPKLIKETSKTIDSSSSSLTQPYQQWEPGPSVQSSSSHASAGYIQATSTEPSGYPHWSSSSSYNMEH